ncbi:nitroreductase family protein [Motiliproteus sp. MSK22-1]|uniref:nitroreductase family protein n=1 Tax=Motiliproteus sp. MSK22-1 TaxID=1897630 RepID=UPI00097630B3|nr:nitroreductase family protein [Motiliproteus sp. MSK22-1]OMH29189.1 NAD(P)H nitroreductase [Motiliproteus sp. MSK22-1]
MANPIKSLIESRVSINYYDTSQQLTDSDIEELISQATRAPSAYNFQNWKFIAVRSPEAKERLKGVCYGQQKVVEAPVTFIICGILEAYKQLPQALKPSVDAGFLDQSVAEGWIDAAKQTHTDNPELQRDEAIRSASLAAMTLMFAAQGMGLATGSMSGFDPRGVAREFQLSAVEVPVIMVTVGYPTSGNWPQKPRRPISEVIQYA